MTPETTSLESPAAPYEPARTAEDHSPRLVRTNIESPQPRVVASTKTTGTVQLRFAPRTVQQTGPDAKTN